jgi:hypothetical protein
MVVTKIRSSIRGTLPTHLNPADTYSPDETEPENV